MNRSTSINIESSDTTSFYLRQGGPGMPQYINLHVTQILAGEDVALNYPIMIISTVSQNPKNDEKHHYTWDHRLYIYRLHMHKLQRNTNYKLPC